MTSKRFGETEVSLLRGDITRQDVGAIVNAANSGLLGGGGVDGAIHRAGGPSILEECKQIRNLQGPCAPGNAVITGAGKLQAQYVIHAVGPIWRGGATSEADTLANAYKSCLELAAGNEVKTIAFPSISTGAYGYPLEQAAKVALSAVKEFCLHNTSIKEVRFVLFDDYTMQAYAAELAAL
jgi:O-acetyl-ADP-ribose deacetylase (regulator of RNase III)